MTTEQELGVSKNSIISAWAETKYEILHSSKAALKDELVYQLSSTVKMNWDTLEITSKYNDRAKSVLYRINLYDFSAVEISTCESEGIFIINTSDLSSALCYELEQLKSSHPRSFDELVTEAIQTLLEGVNKRYYHVGGLPYKVTWRFEL